MRIMISKDNDWFYDDPNIDRSTGALPGQHNRGTSKRQNLDRWHEAESLKAQRHSVTIKPPKSSANAGKVVVGSTVTVREAGRKPETFTLVNATGAELENDKISCQSPLGTALIGKTAGTTVQVTAPKGILKFTILKVK